MRARREESSNPADPRHRVEMAPAEFDFLGVLPQRLRAVLLDPESAPKVIDRLFPKAFSDREDEEQHRRLIGRALYNERLDILRDYEAILDRARPATHGPGHELVLSAADIDLVLHVVNDLRILLGTELGIRDNEWFAKGPSSAEESIRFQVLASLSAIQELLLATLAGVAGRTAV